MRAIIVKSNVEHKFVEKPKEEEIKEIEVDDFGFWLTIYNRLYYEALFVK